MPGDLNPHKHRCGNLSMLAQTALRETKGQLKLQQAYQHDCSKSISEHTDVFIPLLYIPQ